MEDSQISYVELMLNMFKLMFYLRDDSSVWFSSLKFAKSAHGRFLWRLRFLLEFRIARWFCGLAAFFGGLCRLVRFVVHELGGFAAGVWRHRHSPWRPLPLCFT